MITAMFIIIGLQLLITMWLIRYLLKRDDGPQEPKSALLYAGFLGFIAVIIGSFLEAVVIPAGDLPTNTQATMHVATTTLLLACLAVGVIEELCKALPLRRFLYNKSYFDEVSDGIIYFAITGMLFGAIENIGYALTYGSAVGLTRIITIPFMHAGFTSIIGYAIARRKVLGASRQTEINGFILAIALHAIYDFCLFYGSRNSQIVALVITVLANTILFSLYKRARRQPLAVS